MIKENWRPVLLTLLGANLLFIVLLEQQRRFLWQRERDYFIQIEKTIIETDKTKASYDTIMRLLEDIKTRANNVEMAVQEVPRTVEITKDTNARVNSVQTAIERISTVKQ